MYDNSLIGSGEEGRREGRQVNDNEINAIKIKPNRVNLFFGSASHLEGARVGATY